MDATNTQTGLRIPNDLLTQLRALADQDMRTLNAEIIYIIKEYIKAHPIDPPPKGEE